MGRFIDRVEANMPITNARIEELLSMIRSVFHDVPRPACTKRVATAFDDWEFIRTEEQWEELRALDTEQHWWDVSDSEIMEHCTILNWLSPEGFRFYYPAFLSYTIRRWNTLHDRIHCETLDSFWMFPKNLEMFTHGELKFLEEALVELYCDPMGEKYDSGSALRTVENRLKELAESKSDAPTNQPTTSISTNA
jgi:hypothetical protein